MINDQHKKYINVDFFIKTSISEASNDQPYFWIDDLWVTGHLLDHLQVTIHIYDWRNNFLSEHIQYKNDFLHGTMFTPELMVASDINPNEIRHLASKFDQCEKKKCYKQIYESEELKNLMKPPMIIRKSMKQEL